MEVVLSVLLWTLILCSPFCSADTIDITLFKGPLEVQLDSTINLECKLTNYSPDTFNINKLAVQWMFTSKDGTPKEIYVYNGLKHFPKREGTKLSDELLEQGDATLQLYKVQFKDEGLYTCIIFVTLNKGEMSASIVVSVKPTVSLSTKHFTVVSGSEGSVRCDIVKFYPQDYTLKWLKVSSGNTETVVKDICTGAPVPNKDGTFNVSSQIQIEPTMDDDGTIYKCVVTHRTLSSPWITEAKLTVKEPERISGGSIAGAIFGTLIFSMLGFAGLFFVYIKCFQKVSPKVTEISTPATIRHQEEALISCQVTSFRPAKILISLYVKRSNQDKRRIYQWNNIMPQNSDEEENFLSNGKQCCDEPFIPNFSLISSNDGNSSVNCCVKMFPDMYRDNNVELTFEVEHQSLWTPIVKTINLKVFGVPPKISDIVLPPRIVHNELVALVCPINGFKPRPLSITWYQHQSDGSKEEIAYLNKDTRRCLEAGPGQMNKFNHYINETQYEDKTYTVISVLNIIPDIQDDMGMNYICAVHHEPTGRVEEKTAKMVIKGIPKLEQIKSDPKTAVAEAPLKLSCQVNSFYPQTIKAEWFKNNEPLESQDSEPTLGKDKLYHFITSMTTVATRNDVDNKYICKVSHESLTEPVETHWVLNRLVSFPKLTEIESYPPFPEIGKSVTLSCKAYDFYPKENKISWIRDFEKMETKFESEDTGQDPTTGLFYRESKWTFIPEELDHGREYAMEILHVETSNIPRKVSRTLILKGIPSVSDIILDPSEPVYGKELVLTCNVNNFTTQVITTSWFQQQTKIFKGISNQDPEPDDGGCFQCSSSLKLVPNAKDYEKDVSFHVEHSRLTKPIVKSIFLSLPAFSPQLSIIKSDPVSPKINQMTSLSISLSNYVPSGIIVKWFQKCNPYLGTVINSLPEVAENGLFFSTSKIEFQPTSDDQEYEFRCEIIHEETKETQENIFFLYITEGDDEYDKSAPADETNSEDEETEFVSEIVCETKNPKAGQLVTVSCNIQGQNMNSSHITWFKGVYPYEKEDVIEKIPLSDGSFKSSLTFTPNEEDNGILLQCDVITEMEPVSKYFSLQFS